MNDKRVRIENEEDSNDNGEKNEELLRRKRMIVFSLFFDSLASMHGRFSFVCSSAIYWNKFRFLSRFVYNSVIHILHLTKMTFHRISVVCLMHEHFIVWSCSIDACTVHTDWGG